MLYAIITAYGVYLCPKLVFFYFYVFFYKEMVFSAR